MMADLFQNRDPRKVLSVRQPFSWLIVTGRKTIENRTWSTRYRGPLLIHAGKAMHAVPVSEIERRFGVRIDREALTRGAIVGRVDLVDVVTKSSDPWFEGPFGFVLTNPRLLVPISLRGRESMFEVDANTINIQEQQGVTT